MPFAYRNALRVSSASGPDRPAERGETGGEASVFRGRVESEWSLVPDVYLSMRLCLYLYLYV